jgi:FHA domain
MSDEPGTHASEVTKPGEAASTCPECRTPRPSGDRFCETCGHDFEAAPAKPVAWELVIEPDRAYHARFAAGTMAFPQGQEPHCLPLEAAELRIGRSDPAANGADAPQISGAAGDPALSRRHAVLRRRDDGTYAIEDLGSTNGTEVNGRPIAAGEPVALDDGDRVHLGAWTVITIRSRAA